MTWGQLRLQCQLSALSIDLDLIDGWLNTRYEKIIQATDWTGIDAHATIQTKAAYQSVADTVTLTVGSATVTGLGTAWTNAIGGAQQFYRPGDSASYTPTYVSATQLTLDRPYEGMGSDAPGTVYAAAAYVLMQNLYALPADCSTVVEIIDPITEFPMQRMSKAELDASVGVRTLVEDPRIYAIYDDSPETNPPVVHQVEFYPPPLYARGLPLEYRRSVFGFDGQTTGASPLPFVGSLALIVGVRADVATHLKQTAQAMKYESEFKEALADLLRVEHSQRRKAPVMKMAARFTRHRMARAERGMQSAWRGGTPGGSD
jgi:hypothetical protein